MQISPRKHMHLELTKILKASLQRNYNHVQA